MQKSSFRKCGPRALTGTSLLITNFQVEQKNVSELEALQEISVPRCLQESKRLKSVSVQTFVDASSEAYGAVSYLEASMLKAAMSFESSYQKQEFVHYQR